MDTMPLTLLHAYALHLVCGFSNINFTELPINEILDYIPCSCIVIMVHNVVKVVNIVCVHSLQATSMPAQSY